MLILGDLASRRFGLKMVAEGGGVLCCDWRLVSKKKVVGVMSSLFRAEGKGTFRGRLTGEGKKKEAWCDVQAACCSARGGKFASAGNLS